MEPSNDTSDPAWKPAPLTVSVKLPTVTGDGLTDAMLGSGRMVTVALPLACRRGSAGGAYGDVGGIGTVAGATYRPLVLITPTTASPPAMPFTLQVTVPAAPVTVAVNVCAAPVRTDADAGLTVTETPLCIAAPEFGSILQHGRVDRLEVRSEQLTERVQVAVVPARVGLARDVPGRSVVGEHDAVFLHRSQDHLDVGRIGRDVEAGLQPEAFAHARVLRAGQRRGVVAGGPDELAPRLRHGEADRVLDLAAQHLVVGDQPGHDRQAGRVGGGPGRRPQRVRFQIEDRAGIGVPARRLRERAVQLVEDAVGRVDGDRVAVAVRAAAAFDRRIERNRVRPGVALVRVKNAAGILRLGAGHRDERNADRAAVPRGRRQSRRGSRCWRRWW